MGLLTVCNVLEYIQTPFVKQKIYTSCASFSSSRIQRSPAVSSALSLPVPNGAIAVSKATGSMLVSPLEVPNWITLGVVSTSGSAVGIEIEAVV
jgi:hypothetical protein